MYKFYKMVPLAKTYYPLSSAADSRAPLRISMRLSKQAHIYSQSALTMVNVLAEVGGISRTLFAGGYVIAHFVAMHLYRAALIDDLFLVQEPSCEPHPNFKS